MREKEHDIIVCGDLDALRKTDVILDWRAETEISVRTAHGDTTSALLYNPRTGVKISRSRIRRPRGGSVTHGNAYFCSDTNKSEIRGHFSTDKSVAIEKLSKTDQNRDWSDRAGKRKP
jgi:hypothetical protein